MARTVNEREHTEKRNKILKVVQQLVAAKGYDQMSIQDILDVLQISRGAFFHYFNSKQELLEALIEHLLDDIERLLIPIINDPDMTALYKFKLFFDRVIHRKTEEKGLLLPLLHSWYSDSNALVRQKIRMGKLQRFGPLLAGIICKGIEEGSFTTSYPDQVGEVIFSLALDLSETFSRYLLSATSEDMSKIESTVYAYTDAIERILGVSKHSLQLIDIEMLKAWLT